MATTGGGKLSVACPICGESVAVRFEVVASSRQRREVDVRLSTEGPLGEHLTACAAKAGDQVGQTLNQALGCVTTPAKPSTEPVRRLSDADLTGRVGMLLRIVEDNGHLTRGHRACTMCGTNQDDCLRMLDNKAGTLRRKRVQGMPCCASCGQGNTHPTGGESTPCAEWAVEHGATD